MKSKQKNNSTLKFVLAVILVVAVVFVSVKVFGIAISEGKVVYDDGFFSEDNCRCFEKEKPTCKTGWEFNELRGFCVNGNLLTNPVITCSAYECSGIVYKYNFDTKEFEKIK